MMLVDNFKVILLVVLICAAGLQSTEAALNCHATNGTNEYGRLIKDSVTCEEGKLCIMDKDGKDGCGAAAGCTPTEEMYCCDKDFCNKANRDVCQKSPKTRQCEEAKKETEDFCKDKPETTECKEFKKENEVGAGAAGSAGTYGGISIPVVTLVSAFLYHIPLNFSL